MNEYEVAIELLKKELEITKEDQDLNKAVETVLEYLIDIAKSC